MHKGPNPSSTSQLAIGLCFQIREMGIMIPILHGCCKTSYMYNTKHLAHHLPPFMGATTSNIVAIILIIIVQKNFFLINKVALGQFQGGVGQFPAVSFKSSVTFWENRVSQNVVTKS